MSAVLVLPFKTYKGSCFKVQKCHNWNTPLMIGAAWSSFGSKKCYNCGTTLRKIKYRNLQRWKSGSVWPKYKYNIYQHLSTYWRCPSSDRFTCNDFDVLDICELLTIFYLEQNLFCLLLDFALKLCNRTLLAVWKLHHISCVFNLWQRAKFFQLKEKSRKL